ncbi:hypothetical protein [Myceligenerans crystallogenes]|uniref:Flavin-dependent oxidoreductase, luciferase family (Includes alkanesulfonate monooxygenase SsuD and methylene tetrahydromethanopterin reductase) n=1 Tax=Myceligenerans crystallogenes TaxID=316335 RepID=A0ABN2NA67_9MICO
MPPALAHPPTFRQLHLGLDLSGAGAVPASWTGGPRVARQFDAGRTADLVADAERALLDLVTFDDAFALKPTGRELRGHLDSAVGVSRLARTTSRIGLVASLDPSRVPREHVITALASLDRATGGRAAWQLEPRAGEAARILPAVNGVRAGLPGPRTPLVVVRAATYMDLVEVAHRADVVRLRATDLGQAAAMRRALRAVAAGAGRDPDSIRVLLEARVVLAADETGAQLRAELAGVTAEAADTLTHIGTARGFAAIIAQAAVEDAVDGFHLLPAHLDADVPVITHRLVPMLRRAGLFRSEYPGTSLRATLGVPEQTVPGAAGRAAGVRPAAARPATTRAPQAAAQPAPARRRSRRTAGAAPAQPRPVVVRELETA